MADLRVNIKNFDDAKEKLLNLAKRYDTGGPVFPDEMTDSLDTSCAGEAERQCYEALIKAMGVLAALAADTAADIENTRAGYAAADQ